MPRQGVITPPTTMLQATNYRHVCLCLPTILYTDQTRITPIVTQQFCPLKRYSCVVPQASAPDVFSPLTGKCPPCFNCMLPAFTCGQYGECDPYNGQCNCPPGWGGIDCLTPRKCHYPSFIEILAHVYAECDSLADGGERHLREEGKACQCKDGWGGINCNGPSALPLNSNVP
jgi:hypothetical protein